MGWRGFAVDCKTGYIKTCILSKTLSTDSITDIITPTNTAAAPPRSSQADINTLKAQERELAHKIEVNDKLQQLKAEHAALQERIRMAEMQARDLG